MTTKKHDAGFQTLALANIHESTTNPRSIFGEFKLAELAESLRTQGLIQPITVRPNSEGYEIVAGARRFRAAHLAEMDEIPVRIVQLSDEQALEWQLIREQPARRRASLRGGARLSTIKDAESTPLAHRMEFAKPGFYCRHNPEL